MKKILTYYKNLPKNEWKIMREQVSIPEYICWWIIRCLMLYATVSAFIKFRAGEKEAILLLQIMVTTLATFLITLLRVIFPKIIFFGRLPYTAQKYTLIAVFFCSYIGHHHDMCAVAGYDSFLHILTGFLMVFICYEIVMSMQMTYKPLSGFMASVVGFGMNCFVIILWEIFEFIVDFLLDGNLQYYKMDVPSDDFIFFRMFGMPATMEQLPVFDTMFDISLALVSSIPAAVLLWVVVARRNKKAALAQEAKSAAVQETEDTPISV